MTKELVRLKETKPGLDLEGCKRHLKIDGTDTYVNPKLIGEAFVAETLEDVVTAAKNFPMIPSPNAYTIKKIDHVHDKVACQLYYLSEQDYKKVESVLRDQELKLSLLSLT